MSSIDIAIGPTHVPSSPASCFVGEMAYVMPYAHMHFILPLSFLSNRKARC
jgi:hypothetical protein